MEKICPTCKKKFTITKWQKSKIYCSGPCSGGSFKVWNKKRKARSEVQRDI
tara:strand:+ start:154 stop:306 length:153 start_codon:yes stop_codon:yes gene_type:complete